MPLEITYVLLQAVIFEQMLFQCVSSGDEEKKKLNC